MATVEFKSATRVYEKGERPAVDGLNLEIVDGEFLVLVGPSGCGKSTSLRMLAGLEPIDGGEILIDGREVSAVSPSDRNVAMVFQNYALYPNMTVAQNMGFALENQGVAKEKIKEKVAEAAEILELTDLLDRKPSKLSGGQRQRVAMGRAIVREPAVFCMDEPLSNLDAKLRVSTRMQISELQRKLGTTTVYVTHDQTEALTMGDRVAVLNKGVLQQVASTREIYDRPANTFVAGFIGSPSMNLYRLPIKSGRVRWGKEFIHLSAGAEVKGEHVVVGIRPEHLEVAQSGLALEITHIEELGSEAYAYGQPRDDVDTRSLTTLGGATGIRLAVDELVRVGEVIHVVPRSGMIHFFDSETGRRI